MSLLACSGHLLIDLPIFMGPVVLLVGWLLVMTRRARHSEHTGHREGTYADEMGHSESAHAPEHADELRHRLMGVHA